MTEFDDTKTESDNSINNKVFLHNLTIARIVKIIAAMLALYVNNIYEDI
jgi:hypothetical protein